MIGPYYAVVRGLGLLFWGKGTTTNSDHLLNAEGRVLGSYCRMVGLAMLDVPQSMF